MSTSMGLRYHLIEAGRRLAARNDRSNMPMEDAECLVKRALRNEEGSGLDGRRSHKKFSGKKQGPNRKGGEKNEEGTERKRQRRDGSVSAEGHTRGATGGPRSVEESKGPGSSSTSFHATETTEDARAAEDCAGSGPSGSNPHAESSKRRRARRKRNVSS